MARLKIRDHRRNELIDATIASIASHGLGDTTLSTIAAEAGVSPGLVNHYFEGKDELLEATLRHLASQLALRVRAFMPRNPTPLERIRAIIEGCLKDENFSQGNIQAWLHFWRQVPNNERFARLLHAINCRFRSNLLFALKQLMPEDRAVEASIAIYALIDGFWLRSATEPNAVSLDVARKISHDYVAMILKVK